MSFKLWGYEQLGLKENKDSVKADLEKGKQFMQIVPVGVYKDNEGLAIFVR